MIVKEGFDGFSMQKLAKAAEVSPATLYIYFKDREDLLIQLFLSVHDKMTDATLENFDPDMSFSEGLKIQWINRANHFMKYPEQMHFMEQISHSPLHDQALKQMDQRFKNAMKKFVSNAIQRKEIVKIPLEVYWSVAFAPLYSLIKFNMNKKNMAGDPFKLKEAIMDQTLQLVLKALKP